MITDYIILSAYGDSHGLMVKVNDCIAQGWQPYGSPILDDSWWYQAMVKHTEVHLMDRSPGNPNNESHN